MKRILCLCLLLLTLSGCADVNSSTKEPVTFYYIREHSLTDMSQAIGTETREASGHREDLAYLLRLYFLGPTQEGLLSPLPQGVLIETVEQEGRGLRLTLSDADSLLTDSEFSLACACLTLTCLDLVPAERVTIRSGSRSVTMSRENLALFDSGTVAAATEEPT